MQFDIDTRTSFIRNTSSFPFNPFPYFPLTLLPHSVPIHPVTLYLNPLQIHQPLIHPIGLHQRMVITLLDNLAMSKHDDTVGIANRGEAMGDDEGCATDRGAVERGLDEGFGVGV